MILQTERLYLRKWQQEDFADLAEMLQDPRVMYAYEHDFSDADVQEWMERQWRRYQEHGFGLWAMVEKQSGRLRDEAARTLREYVLQVRELFQAEIDIRQNRIMKTLAIVTTIFLPLSLVAGWNGMNFVDMLKLRWRYGYPAVTRYTKRN